MPNNLQTVIKEAREALAAATPGPWKSVTYLTTEGWEVRSNCGLPITGYGSIMQSVHNAHLIANAPTWLQTLLDGLEEQQREIADKNGHIEGLKVAKEIEIENHAQSCFDYQAQIIELQSEIERIKEELKFVRPMVDLSLQDIRTEHAAMKEHIEGVRQIIISGDSYSTVDGLKSVLVSAKWACSDALSTLSKDTTP